LLNSDVENPSSLKNVLRGFDVVVSTLSGGGFGAQVGLVQAAREAGVKRFVPSEFGIDIDKS
jgi:hypothetical protein